ncbi:MAG: hypothetical protein AB7O52_06070 [Planctomycetota bacterium]
MSSFVSKCAHRMRIALSLAVLASSPALAVNELSLVAGQGFPGQVGVPVVVMAKNDAPIHSFSIAVRYPQQDLDFPAVGGVSFDGTASLVAAPSGPAFVAVQHNPATGDVVVGVILELMPSAPPAAIPASPTTAQAIMNLLFDVPSNAAPGTYPFDFVNGIGNPPIVNTFSNAGESSFPTLVNSTFTVLNQNEFRIPDVVARSGLSIVVPVFSSHVDDYQGFQVVVSWNRNLLNLGCVPGNPVPCNVTGRGTTADAVLRPQNPSLTPGLEPWEGGVDGGFVELKYEPGAGGTLGDGVRDLLTVAVVFDFVPPFQTNLVILPPPGTLPPGNNLNQSILFLRFSTMATTPTGTTTMVRLEDGLGSPPQSNFAIVTGGFSVPVLKVNGTVTFDTNVLVFQRADANQDGMINLGDVISTLGFLFSMGAAPLCRDASDANDDGFIDLSDAIYLITYLFANGPHPPQPFTVCGVDLTAGDALDCASYPFAECP